MTDATQALTAYLNAPGADSDYIAECARQAEAIVAEALRSGAVDGAGAPLERPSPPEVRARAVTEVGAELYARRGLRNGIATFGGGDDLQPVRIARDPMHLARALLAPYIGGPFA